MNAIDRLDQSAYEMYNALQVITQDPKIKSYLSHYDPAALHQSQGAVQTYLHRNDTEWFNTNKPYGYWEV